MNLRRRHAQLVALGDSNTALTHLPRSAERWPDSVGRQLELSVLNLGRAGSSLQDAFDTGLVDRGLGSGATFMTVGFALDDCTRLSVAEYAGLLDRLLHQTASTAVTPILLTSVWLDPSHCSSDRFNDDLRPFNAAIRSAAVERGARLVDVAARMEREAARGRWDLRVRLGAMDDRHDAGKSVESGWYDGARLNAAGSKLVAHLMIQSLRQRVPLAS